MKWSEVRIAAPAEQIFQQMAGIMRKRIDAGNMVSEPSGKQINGKREAVHLGEQGYDESRKGTERAPVALALWLGETEGEDDEDQ